MYSSAQELYSYTTDIPQQNREGISGSQYSNYGSVQPNGFNPQMSKFRYHQSNNERTYITEHLENEEEEPIEQQINNNGNVGNVSNVVNNIPIVDETMGVQRVKSTYLSPTEKLKNTMKYYFITLIVPLIIFVLLFVIFSLDFVKESIFGILHIQEDSDQSVSICVCALYGLIIGIVYTLLIKILERFVN